MKPQINKARALSWSQISSFNYDKEQWYRKYVLNEKQEDNAAMSAGKEIGERIASDPKYLPSLPRLPQYEKKLEGKVGDILLVGYLDNFHPDSKAFAEFKTSANTKKWTQKTSDDHGQLSFYYFLIWLNYQKPPEQIECTLHYIPVRETGSFKVELIEPVKIKSFSVKKTSMDILKFGKYIKDVRKEMEQYVKKHK